LLAAAGEAALHSGVDKDRHPQAEEPVQGSAVHGTAAAPEAAPAQSRAQPELRQVHVAEPEPEPEEEQPATLEALAARFGPRRERAHTSTGDRSPATPRSAGGAGDRSRQERDKQAAILAKLRKEAAGAPSPTER
jgi:hypothetical protein